jgi:hypothetical protein
MRLLTEVEAMPRLSANAISSEATMAFTLFSTGLSRSGPDLRRPSARFRAEAASATGSDHVYSVPDPRRGGVR